MSVYLSIGLALALFRLLTLPSRITKLLTSFNVVLIVLIYTFLWPIVLLFKLFIVLLVKGKAHER